jgi:hypothetical protein
MTATPATARFTVRRVHLFKEADGERARTYCGLNERSDIWRDHGEHVTCGWCIRYARREREAGREFAARRVRERD